MDSRHTGTRPVDRGDQRYEGRHLSLRLLSKEYPNKSGLLSYLYYLCLSGRTSSTDSKQNSHPPPVVDHLPIVLIRF